jgi:hypothetical protein
VIAVDIDAAKLARVRQYGAAAVVNAAGLDARGIKDAVRAAAKELKLPPHAWKVLEMSGTIAGQAAAYELLTFAGTVGMIGFTMEKLPVRLGNLMAFDATLFGNWGCLPALYGPALALVLAGKVQTRPFSRRFPLGEINDVIAMARRHELTERAILTPWGGRPAPPARGAPRARSRPCSPVRRLSSRRQGWTGNTKAERASLSFHILKRVSTRAAAIPGRINDAIAKARRRGAGDELAAGRLLLDEHEGGALAGEPVAHRGVGRAHEVS